MENMATEEFREMAASSSSDVNDVDKRWDKLKEWTEVRDEIRLCVQDPDHFDHSITLEHGPQLLQTMRHSCGIRCFTHFPTNIGETFVTNCSCGTISYMCVWTLNSGDKDAAYVQERVEVCCVMSHLLYIPKYRVFVGFSPDMMLRVYTDAKSGFQDVSCGVTPTTVLCMTFNRDTSEVITGCVGAVESWTLQGAEHAAILMKGTPFAFSLEKHDWVLDLQVDNKNKQLLAVCETALLVLNYEKNKQTHHLVNKHIGAMKCCCVYNYGEYLITGSADGSIKVWNPVVFSQVHDFSGHHNSITSLQTHRIDPLLFSSSTDGSVQIWRMDNFHQFMRIDLGEPVFSMRLLGETGLFCQTLKEIKLYNLNQFFSLFAPVESTIYSLKRMSGYRGRPSRIVASCEDGSLRFFSPINGSSITIVYPMPSFQVLSCFVYNSVDNLMYTLLLGGEVLVLNCTSNPCKAVTILSPEAETSEVLDMTIVHMDIRDLSEDFIFGGLRNGQICLVDAKRYRMPLPTQAHHGRVVCLEACTDIDHNALGLDRDHAYLISGGTDFIVRLWRLTVQDYTDFIIRLRLVQQFTFSSPPTNLILSLDVLCATFRSSCDLEMYKICKNRDKGEMDCRYVLKPMYHTADYDHTAPVTSIDQCPAVGIFITSSSDGSVKVWDMENTLIRELNFGERIDGVCFANCRGDILIGFQYHIVSVPILNYLPMDKLDVVVDLSFMDERRESTIPYDHQAQPWFDPRLMDRHPLHLERRLMYDKPERARTVSGQDDPEPQFKAQLVIHAGRFETIDGVVQIVMTEDADFLESIRTKSILHRQALQQTSQVGRKSNRFLFLTAACAMQAERRLRRMIGEKVDEDEGLGEDIEEDTPVAKVIQIYDPQRGLSAWDRELLKRKPIIAPDGYIPNSVIRGILSLTRPITPEDRLPWKPKPVPRPDPNHLPPGWEDKFLNSDEDELETGSVSSIESGRKLVWSDDDEDDSKTISVSPAPSSAPSSAGHAPQVLIQKTIPKEVKPTYKPVSVIAATKVDWNFDKPVLEKKKEKTPAPPKTPKATPPVAKQKSFHAESMEKETEEPVQVEEEEEVKKSPMSVDMDILQRLLAEDWFPGDNIYTLGPAVLKLQEMLDKFGKTPAIHEKICDYVITIQKHVSLQAPVKRNFQEKLLEQMTCEINGIRTDCVRTLRDLGMDTNEIITAILPKLVDPAREVRHEAVIALVELTGVDNTEALGELLKQLGVTKTLNSREDEENALKILRDNLGLTKQQSVTVVESFHDWMNDWVNCSIPGVFEGEEYVPSVEGLMTTGSDKKVQIVSPDGEQDSSLEVKRKESTSSQRKRKPTGKREDVTKQSPQTRQKSRAGQGRQSSRASNDSIFGTRRQLLDDTAISPELPTPNTPESIVNERTTGWESEMAVLLRVESRFRPKGRSRNSYPASRTSQDPQDSGRVTGKSHGRQDSDRVLSNRLLEFAKLSMDKDSDIHSMSASMESTDMQDIVIPTENSQQTEIHSNEGLSIYDSGIGRDMSDASSHGGKLGPVASYKKKVKQRQLSPVKSSSNGSSPPLRKGKDWKEFFETPTAVERKRLGLVKKDYEEGNMKKVSNLPPISYISANLPTSPGEAGLRLLQTVTVGEKDKSESEKHKVEPIPGRLSVHTKNVESGRSSFGVLQMQWTTNVPLVPVSDVSHRKQRSSHMSRSHDLDLSLPPLDQSGCTGSKPQLPLIDMTDSTRFPAVQSAFDNDYQWEKPMPPPPVTKSRTVISPVRRVAHDHMCRHLRLAKKKMHHYISTKSPSHSPSQARGSSFSDLHLPPIKTSKPTHLAKRPPLKLRTLIECIKVEV